MTHWRKSSGDPESAFNSYLAGWAIAASVMLATLMLATLMAMAQL